MAERTRRSKIEVLQSKLSAAQADVQKYTEKLEAAQAQVKDLTQQVAEARQAELLQAVSDANVDIDEAVKAILALKKD